MKLFTGWVLAAAFTVGGLALGAERYLFRPIEPQELLREVTSCLAPDEQKS